MPTKYTSDEFTEGFNQKIPNRNAGTDCNKMAVQKLWRQTTSIFDYTKACVFYLSQLTRKSYKKTKSWKLLLARILCFHRNSMMMLSGERVQLSQCAEKTTKEPRNITACVELQIIRNYSATAVELYFIYLFLFQVSPFVLLCHFDTDFMSNLNFCFTPYSWKLLIKLLRLHSVAC